MLRASCAFVRPHFAILPPTSTNNGSPYPGQGWGGRQPGHQAAARKAESTRCACHCSSPLTQTYVIEPCLALWSRRHNIGMARLFTRSSGRCPDVRYD
jgi:hypothetical protein